MNRRRNGTVTLADHGVQAFEPIFGSPLDQPGCAATDIGHAGRPAISGWACCTDR